LKHLFLKKMLADIAKSLRHNLKNVPGWRISRKIVVIEADDWGGIRMPSTEAYDRLKNWNKNLVGKSRFNKFDSLEIAEDLFELFNVLKKFKDQDGNFARITPFCNVANPDFEKIRSDNFQKYHYLNYKESLAYYKRDSSIFELWEEGIQNKIFSPQYHGREHLTVPVYMRLLQQGNEDVLFGFDNEFCSVPVSGLPALAQSFRPEFYFDNWDDFTWLEYALTDGIRLFNNTFGFKPDVFCPSNGVFHDKFKPALVQAGVTTTVESGKRYIPTGNGNHTTKRFLNGRKDKLGIITYARNCRFEPLEDGIQKSISNTLKEIEAAFRWQKPAVISTHRVNFTGSLYPDNRHKGLHALEVLLKQIVNKWDDVEFMNSAELVKLLKGRL
jgi:hypothetical protein